MFILKSLISKKEVLHKMKINPPDNTDIVEYAQNIIDNYVSVNVKRIKYINPRSIHRKKSKADTALWVTAGILSALTLSLYIFIR